MLMEELLHFTPYGLYVTLALLSGLACGGQYLYRARGLSLQVRLTFCVILIPFVWFFSRLFFVLANCTYYLTTLSEPVLALRFWDGGYSMCGAFAGACAGAVLTAKVCRLSAPLMLDAVGLGFPLGALVARLAEYGTGVGDGRAVTGSWIPPLSSSYYGEYLHPVFLYEAIGALVVFLILLYISRSHHGHPHEGDLLLLCMTLYGTLQSFLESLKDDGHMVVHFVRIQQVLALLMVLISLTVWSRRLKGQGKGETSLLWILTAIAVGLAVLSEFGVDRWGNRLLAYSLLILCLLTILICTLRFFVRTFRVEKKAGRGRRHGRTKQKAVKK